jgi:hypothetical protein
VPTGPGGWWQFLLALVPVLSGPPTGCFATPARSAHAGAVFLSLLDALSGLGPDVEVGMHRREDAVSLPFRAGIDPNGDRLPCSRYWFHVQPDTEQAAFPKRRGLAAFDPTSCTRGPGWHERIALLVDYRYEHVR